jgi:hypothetical protein
MGANWVWNIPIKGAQNLKPAEIGRQVHLLVGQIQLIPDFFPVAFDRLTGYVQKLGNVFVRKTAFDHVADLHFPRRELGSHFPHFPPERRSQSLDMIPQQRDIFLCRFISLEFFEDGQR